MHLNLEQLKIIQSRQTGHILVRGVAGSGKTTVAVHRAEYLLNHYCLDDKDKILIVTYNKTLIKYLKHLYDKVNSNSGFQGGLFAADKSKVEINTIDSIIYSHFRKINKEKRQYPQKQEETRILKRCIVELKKQYPDVNIIDLANLPFLRNEIDWIKSCNYMELSEYQNVDRRGLGSGSAEGPQRLQKNSATREAIYRLMLAYDDALKAEGLIDWKSAALAVLDQMEKKPEPTYTHILVDESQDLTRVQLELLLALYRQTEYSTIAFFADTAQSIYSHSWLVRGRSFTSIGLDMTGKSVSLSKNYRTTTQISQAAYSLIENDQEIVADENYVQPSLIDRQGRYPVIRCFSNARQESEYVIRQIQELLQEHSPRDIVVVARIADQLGEIQNALEANSIPCQLLRPSDVNFVSDSIKLVTIHSVKGLEFKVVFIIGLNEGVMPYISYQDPQDIENQQLVEKKLLYVGMTRAAESLFLTSSGRPSKFLMEIDSRYLRLSTKTNLSTFYPVSIDDYLFSDKLIDIYRKEEKVRQWLLKELMEKYRYPSSLLDVEYKVNNFSKMGSVDICVSVYRKNKKTPYIFLEVKALGSGIEEGLAQLKSYMSADKHCCYGAVTDGNDFLALDAELNEIEDIPMFNYNMLPSSLEQWKFSCLRSNRHFRLERDSDNKAQLAVKDGSETQYFQEQELKVVQTYEGIAAGNPIFVQGKSEAEFYLPKEWALDDCYLLKVSGNSMTGADIHDGDYVLVRNRQVAANWDIVAVTLDDEATLKRYSRMGDSVLLIPENKEYEPIQLQDNQARIMGVVVGILQREFVES